MDLTDSYNDSNYNYRYGPIQALPSQFFWKQVFGSFLLILISNHTQVRLDGLNEERIVSGEFAGKGFNTLCQFLVCYSCLLLRLKLAPEMTSTPNPFFAPEMSNG